MTGMGTVHGHKLPKMGFPFDPVVFELMDQLNMGDLVEGLA